MEAPFYHDDVIALHPFGQPSAFASYSGKNLLRQGKAAGQIPSLSGLQAAASVGAPLLAPASSSSSSSLVSPSSPPPPQPLQQPPPPPAPQASALPSSSAAAPSSSSSSAASSTSSSPAESAMLRLSSSDMERFIIHHHHQQQQHHHQNHHHHQLLHSGGGGGRAGLPTPMSAGLALGPAGSSAFNHGCSAEEKDNFANGFVRALEELHKQNIRQSGSSQLAVTAAGVAGGAGALSPSSLTQLHCSPGLSYDAHHHHQHHHQQQPSYAALQQLSDSRHGSGSNCYAELGGYGPQLGLASGIAATLQQQQQQGLSSAAGAAAGLEYATTSGLYAQSPLQYLPRSQQQLLLLKEEETLQTVPDLMQDAGASTLSTLTTLTTLTTVSTTSSSTCSTSSSSSSAAGGAAGGGGCGGGGGPSELALERAATAPVDMESQEKMKVERKRLRNRIAASKCRKRKLERIARLEEKVAALKANNAQLAGTAGTLRDQVDKLKQRVLNHLGRGCRLAIGATQGTALQAF